MNQGQVKLQVIVSLYFSFLHISVILFFPIPHIWADLIFSASWWIRYHRNDYCSHISDSKIETREGLLMAHRWVDLEVLKDLNLQLGLLKSRLVPFPTHQMVSIFLSAGYAILRLYSHYMKSHQEKPEYPNYCLQSPQHTNLNPFNSFNRYLWLLCSFSASYLQSTQTSRLKNPQNHFSEHSNKSCLFLHQWLMIHMLLAFLIFWFLIFYNAHALEYRLV